ncbi:CxxC-x17-CxxC domain-containing protein [Patescibacteria group bacterium]
MNDQQGGFGDRKMVQGKWSCSNCGTEITELPFEPDGNRPIFCRNCYRDKKGSRQPNDR